MNNRKKKAAPKAKEELTLDARLAAAVSNKAAIEQRLESYKERFEQLMGHPPQQNEIPKKLGGAGD